MPYITSIEQLGFNRGLQQGIEKGIEQLHEGQLITHEEIRAEVDKILNKQ